MRKMNGENTSGTRAVTSLLNSNCQQQNNPIVTELTPKDQTTYMASLISIYSQAQQAWRKQLLIDSNANAMKRIQMEMAEINK